MCSSDLPSAHRVLRGVHVVDFRISAANRSGRPVDLDHARAAARSFLSQLELHPRTELSVTYVDWSEMEQLHLKYMDEPGATDVLSFPMDELRAPSGSAPAVAGALGDIVICPEFAERQVAADGDLTDELDLLLCHGVLHLLGHDHAEPAEYEIMFGMQADLLAGWRRPERSA